MRPTPTPRGATRVLVPALLCLVALVFLGAAAMAQGEEDDGEEGEWHEYEPAGPGAPPGWEEHTEDAPVGGSNVLGPVDRRQPLTNTDQYPLSAITHLQMYDEFGGFMGGCTGAFVGPDVVLTAAHCFEQPTTGNRGVGYVGVIPGRDGNYQPFGSEWGSAWFVPPQWAGTGYLPEWDFALIRLDDSSITDATGHLFIGLLTTETLAEQGLEPAIIGYPADTFDNRMWGHWATGFSVIEAFRLFYDIDTAGGVSGAPVWLLGEHEHQGAVVGIHTLGSQPTGRGTYNAGTRIDTELLSIILDGCDVGGCSISYYIEETSPSPSATNTPTAIPTDTPSPTDTPEPTTASPTETPTPEPTSTPLPEDTPTPGPTTEPDEDLELAGVVPGLVKDEEH